jgi:hypothetical protein
MSTSRRLCLCLLSFVAMAASWGISPFDASAAGESIDGSVLRVKFGEELVLDFVSRDPDFPFPEPGTGQDPELSGATVSIFARGQEAFSELLPSDSGVGRPRWRTARSQRAYRFVSRDGATSTRRLTLNDRGFFRLKMIVPEPIFVPPLQAVGLRIRVGEVTVCALFDGDAVRRDDAEVFFARKASGDLLDGDCSDDRLGAPTCGTESGFPACGGTCPNGEQCAPFQDTHTPFMSRGCICGTPCGPCPVGTACTLAGSNFFICAPVRCGELGEYPVCGSGGCGPWECQPAQFSVAPSGAVFQEGCFCAPSGSCEDSCGEGFTCPAGQTCQVALDAATRDIASCGCADVP